MKTSYIGELVAEESRLLRKFDARARRLMSERRLSYSAAYAEAVRSMPNAYAHYCEARAALTALGVPPIIPAGLPLGRRLGQR